MRCSEIAEQEKSTRIGILSRKELLAQLESANAMHVDNVRHIWESRNCGSCEELAEKHDALAATVEALRKALDECAEEFELSGEHDNTVYTLVKVALAATPQQHLRDVEAKAGRAGFVAGASDAAAYIGKQLQSGATDINLELAPPADKYAESVRQGGAA